MFYGYFAQVERIKGLAKEKEEQARRQQQAAEEIGRQRERLEVLHQLNVAVTSTIDSKRILEIFFEKALAHFPCAEAFVRLRNPENGAFETLGSNGLAPAASATPNDPLAFIDQILGDRSPLIVSNIFQDPRTRHLEQFRQEGGAVSFMASPLVAGSKVLGSLVFWMREEHYFSEEETGFVSTVAGQLAIAIHHSQLFEHVQQQASELRQANKVKDEFLGVVSHELKTPLNVISGYSNMLIEGMLGDVSPIQEKALQTVARQSKELHSLINSVLQVSSIEAEMLQVEPHEVNFWEFMSELRAFYDYPLAKEIKLIWEVPADLPVLYADRGKLKHILENLINNAIKFTDRGTVTISARYIASKKMMEFKVTDTGVGIPKDLLPTIFERFRQADSSDTRAHGGVGLGLYIVKKYANLLGGTIHVESKVGHGSAFTLRTPCQSHRAPSAHQQLSLPTEMESRGSELV
jgi:signal transduction histidine kinase